MEKKKVVCLISGGIDSTTAAATLKHEGWGVYGLTMNYGQIGKKECEAAKRVCEKLGIPLTYLDLTDLQKVMQSSSLVNPAIVMTETFTAPIIVPNRNSIMLSIAIAFAYSIGADAVSYGAHLSDRRDYPDCRKEFIETFLAAERLATERDIKFLAPNIGILKSDVVKMAKHLGVPIGLTWSCYKDGEKHCGRCESCNNRKKAFQEAGIKDPVKYEVSISAGKGRA